MRRKSISYIYSADGQKLATEIGSSLIYYRGGLIYNANVLDKILHEEGLVVKSTGGYSYYYSLKDHLGSTRVLCKGRGSTLTTEQTTEYYPFGLAYSYQNLDKNPYLYSGKEYLSEVVDGTNLALYDFGSRFYDVELGRWNAVDPALQLVSPYGYCLNNPLVYVDPSGEIVFTIIGALLAPVTGGASLAIGIAMDVTAAVNVASNWNDISSGNGDINVGKFAMYYGIGSLNGAAAATGQAWAIGLTGSATSLLNSSVREGGFKNLTTEHLVSAAVDGAISFGGAKLTLPNSGKSLFGFKHSSSNLNLSSKVTNKLFSSWGESALATYLGDQIVKYPYTFVTGSLKYGALSNDPNKSKNMWKVGFSQANTGALYDFGGMAYQSSINMQYKLYNAEKNYQMSLELSIQKARASNPGNNYNLPVQNYFYMPSISPFFYMNLNIND